MQPQFDIQKPEHRDFVLLVHQVANGDKYPKIKHRRAMHLFFQANNIKKLKGWQVSVRKAQGARCWPRADAG